MPSTTRKRVLTSRSTTTTPTEDEINRWAHVYHSAVEYGRQEGYKQGHRDGHREGWEQGYNAHAAQDETFAQLVADRLYRDGVRATNRKALVKQIIEQGRAQEARRTHYERFDAKQGQG